MTAQADTAPLATAPAPARAHDGELWALRAALLAVAGFLAVFVLLPLGSLLVRAVLDRGGAFVGLANIRDYLASPALAVSLGNSLLVAGATTALVVPLAFVYAYALTRSRLPGRGLLRHVALLPLLAPSLLPAIALVYLFGNQGVLRGLLMGHSVYGPIGVVMGMAFYVFPHVLMILVTALATADGRLYEAAEALGAGRWTVFRTVTLPGARYGLVSASVVAFTLAITDFGVPKVIGGSFDVLATDVYKQVVGQQNFSMGAVVGLVLLVPAVVAFAIDVAVQRRQSAAVSARSVPLVPRRSRRRDAALLAVCLPVAAAVLGILGTAAWASTISFWPYNLAPTWRHYDFAANSPDGWLPYLNSLEMAGWTALAGSAVIFTGAYLMEKGRGHAALRHGIRALAMVPLAVPGLVLGIAYIFFFNAPANPLGFLYGTMAILVLSTVAHFYTVAHLTAVTALKQVDAEFEAASASLKVPFWTTYLRVTAPVCLPAILDIAVYLFVNAMTTVSAVVFLYAPDTKLASIAVLNMDDVGDTAPAAAMAMLIFATAFAVRVLFLAAARTLVARTQAWRG
ncbi:putative 2-aminoethylphosphonate ABC transporter permease subunit [Azospirillum sp. ST 5-10]|uniref:putative 2-aminoethylphosphonate ABC transporter permease subunit n=1 Tax=unclassified Azospirillum TaxID=2630922 RepID=UPI003F4A1465